MKIVRNIILLAVVAVFPSVVQAGYRLIGNERFYFYGYNEIGLHKFVMLWNCKVDGHYELPTSIYDDEYENGYDEEENPLPLGATLTLSEIQSQALKNQKLMTSLVIPANYTVIGREAFCYCDVLETATFLGDHDINIGSSLFQACPKLKNVKLPAELKLISSQMFNECTSLETLDIPQSVTNILSSAFSGCTSLSSLELPRDLEIIGAYAFQNCTALTSLEIPSGVTSMYVNTFAGCSNIKQLTFKGNAPTIMGTGTKFNTLYSNGCVALVPEGATGFDVDKNGQWYGLTVQRYSLGSWDSVTDTTTIDSIPGLSAADQKLLADKGVKAAALAAWAKGKGGVAYGTDNINLNAFLMNADNGTTELVIDDEILVAVISANPNHSSFKKRFPNAKVEIIEVNEGALQSREDAKFYRLKLDLPTK